MSYAEQYVSRLLNLTQQGLLDWSPYWEMEEEPITLGELEDSTRPSAFVLVHPSFGRVALMLSDPMNESDDPVLVVNGERVEAPAGDLRLLVDVVLDYLRQVQVGQMVRQEDRLRMELERQREVYEEERRALVGMLQRFMEQSLEQTRLLARLVSLLDGGEELPLTADTLLAALSSLGEERLRNPETIDRATLEEAVSAARRLLAQ